MNDKKEYRDIMTLAEAAEYVRLTQRTVRGLAQRGEIPCAKLSTRWRFNKAALDSWIAGRAAAPVKKDSNDGD